MSFGGSQAQNTDTQTAITEQVGGGDIGGGAIIGTGGSDISITNNMADEAFELGSDAFDFGGGVLDTAFETIATIAGQSRNVEAQAAAKNDSSTIKLNPLMIVGLGVGLLLLLKKGR